jgi:DNA repair exonuclease SbcCD ATPase subunit
MNDETRDQDVNEQDEAQATEGEAVVDEATEAAEAAPEPQAYAQHINPEIQLELDRFGRHVDSLTEAVLESADLANRSAMATTGIAEDFKNSIGAWNDVNNKNILYLKVLVIVGGIVMFLSSVMFTVSALRLGSRVSELDAMMMAVGKRVVELNASTQDVGSLRDRIETLNDKQAAIVVAQEKLAKEVRDSLAQTSELLTQLPGQAAKQVAMSNGELGKQVASLKASMEDQAKTVKELGGSVAALKGRIGNVSGLQRQVEAMVKLEKERYLETMQRAAQAQQQAQPQAPKPKPLAYPPPKPEGN